MSGNKTQKGKNGQKYNTDQLVLFLITKLKKDVGASVHHQAIKDMLPWPVPMNVLGGFIIPMFDSTTQRVRKTKEPHYIFNGVSFLTPPQIGLPMTTQINLTVLKASIVQEYISHGQMYTSSAPDHNHLKVSLASYWRGIKHITISLENKSLSVMIDDIVPVLLPDGINSTYQDISDLLSTLRSISFLIRCASQVSDSCARILVPSQYAIRNKQPYECSSCKSLICTRNRINSEKIREETSKEFLDQLTKVHPNFRKYVELQLERAEVVDACKYPPEIMEIALKDFERGGKGYRENIVSGHMGRLPGVSTLSNYRRKLAKQSAVADSDKSPVDSHNKTNGQGHKSGGTKKRKNDTTSSIIENDEFVDQEEKGVQKKKKKNYTSSSSEETEYSDDSQSGIHEECQLSTGQEEKGVQKEKKKKETKSSSKETEDRDDYVVEIHGENELPTGQVEIGSANIGFVKSTNNPLHKIEGVNAGNPSFEDESVVFEYDGEKWVDKNGTIIDDNYSLTNPGEANPVSQEDAAVKTEKLPNMEFSETENETKKIDSMENSILELNSSEDSEENTTEEANVDVNPCSVELAQIGNILDQMKN